MQCMHACGPQSGSRMPLATCAARPTLALQLNAFRPQRTQRNGRSYRLRFPVLALSQTSADQMQNKPDRTYQIVVWGSTGIVGRLVSRHLSQHYQVCRLSKSQIQSLDVFPQQVYILRHTPSSRLECRIMCRARSNGLWLVETKRNWQKNENSSPKSTLL